MQNQPDVLAFYPCNRSGTCTQELRTMRVREQTADVLRYLTPAGES